MADRARGSEPPGEPPGSQNQTADQGPQGPGNTNSNETPTHNESKKPGSESKKPGTLSQWVNPYNYWPLRSTWGNNDNSNESRGSGNINNDSGGKALQTGNSESNLVSNLVSNSRQTLQPVKPKTLQPVKPTPSNTAEVHSNTVENGTPSSKPLQPAFQVSSVQVTSEAIQPGWKKGSISSNDKLLTEQNINDPTAVKTSLTRTNLHDNNLNVTGNSSNTATGTDKPGNNGKMDTAQNGDNGLQNGPQTGLERNDNVTRHWTLWQWLGFGSAGLGADANKDTNDAINNAVNNADAASNNAATRNSLATDAATSTSIDANGESSFANSWVARKRRRLQFQRLYPRSLKFDAE